MSSQLNVNHFSHPHALVLSNYETTVTCSCCTLQASGWIHGCKACNYFLHVECLQLPEKAPHACDDHTLCLLAKPTTPPQTCTACNSLCRGFSYVCKECNTHLHVACARVPLITRHGSHSHNLSLTFSSPKKGNCKICSNVIGDKQWWYRCSMCNFDAHVDCANSHQTVGNSSGSASASATSQSPSPPVNMPQWGGVTSQSPFPPVNMPQWGGVTSQSPFRPVNMPQWGGVTSQSPWQPINMPQWGGVTSISPLQSPSLISNAAMGVGSIMINEAVHSLANHLHSTHLHNANLHNARLHTASTNGYNDGYNGGGGLWDSMGDTASGFSDYDGGGFGGFGDYDDGGGFGGFGDYDDGGFGGFGDDGY